jgi:hypothetical protein
MLSGHKINLVEVLLDEDDEVDEVDDEVVEVAQKLLQLKLQRELLRHEPLLYER